MNDTTWTDADWNAALAFDGWTYAPIMTCDDAADEVAA